MDSVNNGSSSNNNSSVSAQTVRLQADANDQIRKLGEKVEKTNLPEELKELLTSRVQRLALLRASAGFLSATYILEYESTASYINWVINLPWISKSQDILDLNHAKTVLDKNHYGMQNTKDRILEYLASLILNAKQGTFHHFVKAPVLCFVGLPGTGKTTFAMSIAESLGRNFERIPFGGMGDSRALRGQSRALADSEPGYIIKKLIHAKTNNCVILLDELDRVSQEARADIMGVLVELLDPEQNSRFIDHYIDYSFDLTNVLFIATANNTTNVSTAVLDRLEVIQMPSYQDAEKIIIAKSYLFPKVREESGLSKEQLVIDEDVWPAVIRPLGYDSGIRSLKRTIEGICRKTSRQIVEGKTQAVHITNLNVKEFLPML